MQYQFIKAMAESFEHVSPIESASYHYLYNADSRARHAYYQQLHDHFYHTLLQENSTANPAHIHRVIDAALTECTYPTATDSYAWTVTDRHIAAGISRASWYRHDYNKLCISIIDAVYHMSATVEALIARQIGDYYRPMNSA